MSGEPEYIRESMLTPAAFVPVSPKFTPVAEYGMGAPLT